MKVVSLAAKMTEGVDNLKEEANIKRLFKNFIRIQEDVEATAPHV